MTTTYFKTLIPRGFTKPEIVMSLNALDDLKFVTNKRGVPIIAYTTSELSAKDCSRLGIEVIDYDPDYARKRVVAGLLQYILFNWFIDYRFQKFKEKHSDKNGTFWGSIENFLGYPKMKKWSITYDEFYNALRMIPGATIHKTPTEKGGQTLFILPKSAFSMLPVKIQALKTAPKPKTGVKFKHRHKKTHHRGVPKKLTIGDIPITKQSNKKQKKRKPAKKSTAAPVVNLNGTGIKVNGPGAA